MNVVAYTAQRYERATRKAVGRGALVYTCPPLRDVSFQYDHRLNGFELVVLNLHGYPTIPALLGDNGVIALKAETLTKMDFSGFGVFALSCYLGDEPSIMMNALWRANAGWVVAGAGENYGGRWYPVGADVLLKYFRQSLEIGHSPGRALARAKARTKRRAPRWTKDQRLALSDALEFKLIRRPE